MLTNDEFLALLSENVELAEGIFRLLIHSRQLGVGHTLIHGTVTPELKDRVSTDLQPVDRLLLLQSSPLLAHATAAQLWRLSAIARPVTLAAGSRGDDPRRRGGDPDRAGRARCTVDTPDGQSATATAGDVIGMYETLGGIDASARR